MKLSDEIGNQNPDYISDSLLQGWQYDVEALEAQIEKREQTIVHLNNEMQKMQAQISAMKCYDNCLSNDAFTINCSSCASLSKWQLKEGE